MHLFFDVLILYLFIRIIFSVIQTTHHYCDDTADGLAKLWMALGYLAFGLVVLLFDLVLTLVSLDRDPAIYCKLGERDFLPRRQLTR